MFLLKPSSLSGLYLKYLWEPLFFYSLYFPSIYYLGNIQYRKYCSGYLYGILEIE